MIRILQIVKRMDRGGLETFIMDVYRAIDKTRIQFDFLTHSDIPGAYDDEIRSLGGRIFCIRSRRKSYLGNRHDLDIFFNKHHEYQIVHMHESSMSYITPLEIARRYGVKNLILHSRSNNTTCGIIFKIFNKINQIIYKNIITEKYAVSKESAIWMFGRKDYILRKVSIVKNGIDSYRFIYNTEYRYEIRRKLDLKSDEIVIGNIGRLSKSKNQIFLLKIFNQIFRENKKYRLIIIGDGSELKSLQDFIHKNRLADAVSLLQSKSDIYKYYNAFDLFVFPSLFEGLGRVLLEAQCNGLSCLASKIVIPEEVQVLPTFRFVELNNERDWIESIKNIPLKRFEGAKKYIDQSGYDILRTVNFLQNRYLEMVNRE